MAIVRTEEPHMQIPHDTEQAVDPHLAQWFVRTAVILWGLYSIAAGAAIVLGGPERWAGVSYQVALNLPGAPWSWGLAVLVAGVLILTGAAMGRPRRVAAGGLIGVIWATMFALAFLSASLRYVNANTTAFPAYCGIAGIFALIGGVYLATDPPCWIRRTWRRIHNRKG